MSTSLDSIPSLIPAPPETNTSSREQKEDIFSTLFSPATPRASPTLDPVPDANPRRPHPRTFSTSSADFGSFISVPAAEDPLAPPVSFSDSEASDLPPLTPLKADFFEEARAATEKNQQGFLAELLEHEDDPMYWHKQATGSAPTSGGATPLRAAVTPQPEP
ncbi:hypothetical protein FA95DRAFT_1489959, partial [Auriscalpium vulgare]